MKKLVCVCFFLSGLPAFAELDEAEAGTATSCSEICVQILCGIHDREYSSSAVREMLELGDFGEASIANLARCLDTLGFKTSIVKADSKETSRWHGYAILHAQEDNNSYGHFSVVHCDDRGKLTAFDPVASPRPTTFTRESLAQRWTGHAILINQPKSDYHLMAFAMFQLVCVFVLALK